MIKKERWTKAQVILIELGADNVSKFDSSIRNQCRSLMSHDLLKGRSLDSIRGKMKKILNKRKVKLVKPKPVELVSCYALYEDRIQFQTTDNYIVTYVREGPENKNDDIIQDINKLIRYRNTQRSRVKAVQDRMKGEKK